MKWEGQRRSDNVEDRRAGGAGGGFGLGGRSVGIGTVVVALLAGWIFGINPLTMLGLLAGGGDGAPVAQTAPPPPENDRAAAFVSTVLADTEDVWTALFAEAGSAYEMPRLVLFRGRTPTACGGGDAAAGPFYCPADRKVYIDLGFFDALAGRLGAPGDFAQAYVVAHEVGHHVQNLLGVTGRIDAMRGRAPPAELAAMSVRLELQADCLAGVWAQRSQRGKGWLEQGDLEEALNAASRIGDDTLQREAGGVVVPERFTHGSSAQRVAWLRRGYQRGDVRDCDTFAAREP